MSEEKKDLKYEILSDDYTQYDISFKIIVIGDSGVGKSCITNKATKNIFEENYHATVGFEFFNFNLKINGQVVKLQIWDTCGQELYRSLITNFYRNSSLAIIVYSVTSESSFQNIDIWLRELRTQSSPDVKVILIGNKIDLEEQRKISREEGELFAKTNNLEKLIETSAKSGLNIEKTFVDIGLLLYEDYLKYKDDDCLRPSNVTIKSIESSKRNVKKNDKNSCC